MTLKVHILTKNCSIPSLSILLLNSPNYLICFDTLAYHSASQSLLAV